MKIIILIFLSFMVLHTGAQTIYPSGVSGCIARWTFDDPTGNLTTIQDASGNNNHGTNNSIVSVAGWKGGANKAGKFNGLNSFSRVTYNPLFMLNEVTALALVKFDGFFSGSCQGNNIVYNGFDYNSNLNWSLYTSDNVFDGSCATYSPNNNKTYFTTPNFTNPGIPANNYIDSSKWYLIGATFNGTTVNYYEIVMDSINKVNTIVPTYSIANNYPIGTTNADIFMGATQNPPFPYWFNGKMDEVIVFNRALTNGEIQSVYDFLYGYPVGVADITKNNEMRVSCTNKHLRFSPETSKIKSVHVLDLNGKIIAASIGGDEIDLSNTATQMIFVKILSQDNSVSNHKVLLRD